MAEVAIQGASIAGCALAELGELRVRALATEELPTELSLELPNGAGERRLGDVALLSTHAPCRKVRKDLTKTR